MARQGGGQRRAGEHAARRRGRDGPDASDWLTYAYLIAGVLVMFGPVAWLGPRTGEVLVRLAREGVKQVVVCPIAFVSDHVETLYEIRMLFAEEAKAAGITHYVAADGLNDHPAFVDALAKAGCAPAEAASYRMIGFRSLNSWFRSRESRA